MATTIRRKIVERLGYKTGTWTERYYNNTFQVKTEVSRSIMTSTTISNAISIYFTKDKFSYKTTATEYRFAGRTSPGRRRLGVPETWNYDTRQLPKVRDWIRFRFRLKYNSRWFWRWQTTHGFNLCTPGTNVWKWKFDTRHCINQPPAAWRANGSVPK
jgi:hypothetical protein